MARPARTPEGRESQLVNMAMLQAEQQLRDGTAPPSVLVHFLRLGSMREELERLKMTREIELLQAKRENLDTMKELETLYNQAIEAHRSYRSSADEDV